MQPKIVYTVKSQEDLKQITWDLTERANMRTAIQIVQKIYDNIEYLALFPKMGKLQADGTREIYPEKYRVVYRYENDQVVVLTVLHSRMLYPRERLQHYT